MKHQVDQLILYCDLKHNKMIDLDLQLFVVHSLNNSLNISLNKILKEIAQQISVKDDFQTKKLPGWKGRDKACNQGEFLIARKVLQPIINRQLTL